MAVPSIGHTQVLQNVLERCFLKASVVLGEASVPSWLGSGEGGARSWGLVLPLLTWGVSCGWGQKEIGRRLWGEPLFAHVISKERGNNDLLMLL